MTVVPVLDLSPSTVMRWRIGKVVLHRDGGVLLIIPKGSGIYEYVASSVFFSKYATIGDVNVTDIVRRLSIVFDWDG